jgi:hypothetical protein
VKNLLRALLAVILENSFYKLIIAIAKNNFVTPCIFVQWDKMNVHFAFVFFVLNVKVIYKRVALRNTMRAIEQGHPVEKSIAANFRTNLDD